MKLLERFIKRTKRRGTCLIWQGCRNSDGYARAYINGNFNGKVHREVFRLVNGYLPSVVRHTCDVRECINPDHLRGDTSKDNIQDRQGRGRTYGYVTNKEGKGVLGLLARGMTYAEIADELNIKIKRVEYICIKWSKGQVQSVDS